MDDPRLRAEFHLAIDAVAPPAPWLFAVVRDDLRQRSHERPARQAAARVIGRPTWVLPLVAVVLSVAIVLALLFVAVELHPSRTIPVKPPPGPAAGGCPVWGTQSAGGFVPAPDTMSTASTGWSNGALRTTDGGAHWRDVSPAAMRADAPSGTGKRDYPPSYADFFLDSTHAWIARTYQSVTSCLDHVSVFMTADGGRTWRTSMPVGAAVRADSSAQLLMDFTDARRGWLMILANGRLAPDWFLYSTTDSGINWELVSQLPPISSSCSVRFVSETTGFLGDCLSGASSNATITVTRDGGKTWVPVPLPEPSGNNYTVSAPVFLDPNRGIVQVITRTFQVGLNPRSDFLAATTDGGRTWHALPPLPGGFSLAFDFADPNSFWGLMTVDNSVSSTLYRSTDGGVTWTLVNSKLPAIDSATIRFVNAGHGFIIETNQAIGQGPSAVLVTTDGGRTWTSIHPQVS